MAECEGVRVIVVTGGINAEDMGQLLAVFGNQIASISPFSLSHPLPTHPTHLPQFIRMVFHSKKVNILQAFNTLQKNVLGKI